MQEVTKAWMRVKKLELGIKCQSKGEELLQKSKNQLALVTEEKLEGTASRD